MNLHQVPVYHAIMNIVERAREVAQRIRGMTLGGAAQLIVSENLSFRVISMDGIQVDGQDDLRPCRINIETIDGVVVDARVA